MMINNVFLLQVQQSTSVTEAGNEGTKEQVEIKDYIYMTQEAYYHFISQGYFGIGILSDEKHVELNTEHQYQVQLRGTEIEKQTAISDGAPPSIIMLSAESIRKNSINNVQDFLEIIAERRIYTRHKREGFGDVKFSDNQMVSEVPFSDGDEFPWIEVVIYCQSLKDKTRFVIPQIIDWVFNPYNALAEHFKNESKDQIYLLLYRILNDMYGIFDKEETNDECTFEIKVKNLDPSVIGNVIPLNQPLAKNCQPNKFYSMYQLPCGIHCPVSTIGALSEQSMSGLDLSDFAKETKEMLSPTRNKTTIASALKMGKVKLDKIDSSPDREVSEQSQSELDSSGFGKNLTEEAFLNILRKKRRFKVNCGYIVKLSENVEIQVNNFVNEKVCVPWIEIVFHILYEKKQPVSSAQVADWLRDKCNGIYRKLKQNGGIGYISKILDRSSVRKASDIGKYQISDSNGSFGDVIKYWYLKNHPMKEHWTQEQLTACNLYDKANAESLNSRLTRRKRKASNKGQPQKMKKEKS